VDYRGVAPYGPEGEILRPVAISVAAGDGCDGCSVNRVVRHLRRQGAASSRFKISEFVQGCIIHYEQHAAFVPISGVGEINIEERVNGQIPSITQIVPKLVRGWRSSGWCSEWRLLYS
jgi:hypothetical protein